MVEWRPGFKVHRLLKTGLRSGLFGIAVCVACLWLLSASVFSVEANAGQADQTSTAGTNPISGVATAPVVFNGRELFRVRGVSAYPAAQRAQEIAGRLLAVAADRSIQTTDLQIVESGDQTTIQAGSLQVTGIVDADADLEGVSRDILARTYLKRIQDEIERYRHDRHPRVLLKSGLLAAGATILLAGILFLIFRVFGRIDRFIERRYKARIQGVRIQDLQLVYAEQMWMGVHGGVRAVRSLAALAVCLMYAEYVMSLFPWTRPLSERGLWLLLDPLRTMAVAFLNTLPNLVFIAVLILVLRYILKLARIVFSAIDLGGIVMSGFDRDWAWPTYKIFRTFAIAFAAVVAYPYIPGANTEAFKGVSIFMGIVFSLGSTTAMGNIIAGYMMIYRRTFKVGDRIQVSDLVGDVLELRLQVTHLRSLKNEEIILPNSQILNSNVINYSRIAKEHGLILHTTVGIGYETPWRQVEAMLLAAAGRTRGLLREPPPFVLHKQLGDFCVVYEINVYCDRPQEGPKLYTELHRNILDVFNEYGVQIMTPAYESDPVEAKVVPREKWFEAPAQPQEEEAEGSSEP